MKNFSLNVNKVTIFITVATLFFTFFGELLPLSPKLETAIVGFIGAIGALIKTYQAVPTKDDGAATQTVKRISVPPLPPIAIICMALLLGGCTHAQEAKALPTLDFAQAVAQKAANVLDFVEPFLPPGDAQLAAARAAQTAGDLSKVFDVARPLLERVAAGGDDVPQQIVADVVIGAQAAQSVEQGMRAVSGRNPDGSPKD